MPEQSKTWLDDTTLRVMTYKSGSFTFALHINHERLQATIDRVNDAQVRFNKMPGLPQIIDQMQDKILASSIYSTNTIEGGEFSEEETEKILKIDPKLIQKTEEKRLTNLKQALEWVKQYSQKNLKTHQGQSISLSDILTLHELVSQEVDEKNNPPRQFRNNQPTQKTLVGNDTHGGSYRPPKCIEDIEYLMRAWIEWLNHPSILEQSVLVRASLAHYYFELIHPFWDGNGRTGRLIEMLILEQSGYRFSSSAVWKFYQQNIHEYFGLFNQCRKHTAKKDPDAQHEFVEFMVRGMLSTINDLHDQGNHLIHFLLYQTTLNGARNQGLLSERQYRLIELYITDLKEFLTPSELYRKVTIQALFKNKTERTYFRDIEKIVKMGFLLEHDGKLIPNWL
ncbi:Fic family protein [Acinetobacter guerrae]|uniref:Fic family protein n=1 Tax=Acinetobacter guerrae TaxID=1843371 RepID=A0A3A8EFS4_9GAMM|nr:Fic family protein [Acinetobacter guerrae]RKG32366.1 Fic family protein [Acinetobacter guerrae]